MADVSRTFSAHLEVARRNQALVLAEGALAGERQVSVVRLVVQGVRVVVMPVTAMLSGAASILDPVRAGIAGGYVVYCAIVMYLLWRAKPNLRRAEIAPFFFTGVDFAFIVAMAVLAGDPGTSATEMSVMSLAVILGFSAVRANGRHVPFAVTMAIGSYLFITWWSRLRVGQPVSWVTVALALTGFGALGRLLSYLSAQVGEMFVGLRRRDQLARFLPPQVLERVMSLDRSALDPIKREVTVLFSDLRDFTTLSEKMDPRELLALLDSYFGHMSQIVKAHQGIVNKFLGDGMLCFWGVPEKNEAHPVLAVQAALDMRKKLVEINAQRALAGEDPLRFGIGIHTGVVAAGMLGGDQQHEYTVIGDAVNVAARVEGLTKVRHADLLVSGTTWDRLGGRFPGVLRGSEKVKGRDEPVTIYALS